MPALRKLISPRMVSWYVLVVAWAALCAQFAVTRPGDRDFYQAIAARAAGGSWPYRDYWVEYPPVFPLLTATIGLVLGRLGAVTTSYGTVELCMMGVVYVANLALLVGLARQLRYSSRQILSITSTYLLCPLLSLFTFGWFDALAVTTLLAALFLLFKGWDYSAGVTVGIGALTKVFPVVLLLALPWLIPWRRYAKLAAAAVMVSAAVLAALIIWQRDLVLASAVALLARPAWETIPAVITGQFAYGRMPALSARGDPRTAWDGMASGTSWLLLVQLGTLFIAAAVAWYRRPRAMTGPRHVVLVTLLWVLALLLGSKGFSIQFLIWIIPLLLLVWPNRVGAGYVAVLTAYALAYYALVLPAEFAYMSGAIDVGTLLPFAWGSVVLRTTILGILLGHVVMVLWRVRPGTRSLSALRSGTSQVTEAVHS